MNDALVLMKVIQSFGDLFHDNFALGVLDFANTMG
jgi:hypothetical protein